MVQFFPKNEKFFDLLDIASDKISRGIGLLKDMMLDLSDAEEKAKRIKDVEHEADEITHETIARLHKTFVTPIDREDLHSLITQLDDILDFIDSVSERTFLYGVKTSTPEAMELVEVLENTIKEVVKGVTSLRNMKHSEEVLSICIEINRLENRGDTVYRAAISNLFKSSMELSEIIKWKDIYEMLESAIDRCEDIANILEGIVLKNA